MIDNINPADHQNTCFIVGGGTSLIGFDWSLLDDKFVIAVNNAYSKLPNAQVLYCTDPPWIQDHYEDLKKFDGLIYQGVLRLNIPAKIDLVDKQWHLTGVQGLETKEGCMRHGSNSTYAAINMAAVHLGFKQIYLLGIDMRWAKRNIKSSSHWHSDDRPHKRIDGEAVYSKMRDAYKTIVKPLQEMGVNVTNITPKNGSNLDTFETLTFEEAFKTK